MSHATAWFQGRRQAGTAGAPRAIGVRQRNRFRPLILPLEDRRLLATFSVSSTADTLNALLQPTPGTLRWAVEGANAAKTPTTIAFNLGSGPQTIKLMLGALELSNTEAITINGPGANELSVSGNQKSQVFIVDNFVTASLSGLTITGGATSQFGGGLYNGGTVTLTDCAISGNSATESGGGVYNGGSVTLTDCTLSGNSAPHDGGAVDNIGGNVILTDCTLSGNQVVGNGTYAHDGSALFNTNSSASNGSVALVSCTVSGNSTPSSGSALYTAKGAVSSLVNTIVAGDSGGDAGGVGKLDASDNDLVNLTAAQAGVGSLGEYGGPTQTIPLLPGSRALTKGIVIPGLSTDQRGLILGSIVDIGAFQASLVVEATAGTLDTNPNASTLTLPDAVGLADQFAGTAISFDPAVFAIAAQTITLGGSQLELSNTALSTSITGPSTGVIISGGRISRVFQVDQSVIASLSGLTITDGSVVGSGAGVSIMEGALTLTGCTISNNVANVNGGGVNNDGGTATFANCTISGNKANNDGGGLYAGLDNSVVPTSTLTDTTVANNSAAASGGGMYDLGTLMLFDCTFSGNSASVGGGLDEERQATLENTIIAGNSEGGGFQDINGAGTLAGSNNLIGTTGKSYFSDPTTDVNNIFLTAGQSPGLGRLGNYGGLNYTIPLLPGSPALDAGTAGTGVPTTDERGEPRFGPTDIGAFESQGFTLTADPGSTPQAMLVGNPFPTDLTVTVTANLPIEPVSGGTVTFEAPSTNASASLVPQQPFVINSNDRISVKATANEIGGSYDVTVSPGGIETGTSFVLTNQIEPTFSSLTDASIVYGSTAPLTIGGTIQAGTTTPTGSVEITLNGDAQSATIGTGASAGDFSATFDVADLPVLNSGYTITYAYAANADLLAANDSSTLTVTPAPLTITANNASTIYGAALPSLSASYSGLVNGDTAASLTTTPKLSTTATAASPVVAAGYPITASGVVDGNYTITYVAGKLTVTPVPLTITANSASKVYGAALPSLPASYSGLVNGDTASSLTTPPKLTTTATAASPVDAGGYLITASGAADGNYTITYVAGTLTVTPAPLTIVAENASTVYGAALPSLSASYSGLDNGDTASSLTTPPKLSTTATAASPVLTGGYPITISGAADGNYTIAYLAGTLTVTPAPLTIAANSASTVYGAALPSLSASYSGLVNGDTAASLTTPPKLSTTSTAASPVVTGGYPITASGAVDGNYTITYVTGTVTVTPAPLTIAANNASTVYGAALPTLSASYSGLVNGDTAASLTTLPNLSTTATAASLVVAGGYPITASGAVDVNYNITYASGTLTVTPAALTITANNASTGYGTALPSLSASYSGLVNGDTASSLTTPPKLSTTATAASPVVAGGYPITISSAADGNYAITYVAGTLSVNPAPLTIVAENASTVYGAALPSLSASYSGLVNGDTASSLTTPPKLSTIATAASPVLTGGYPITVSGAADGNYTIAYLAGTLTVTPAPLTITANNASKVYGAALPSLSASYAGLVNGDTAASLTTLPKLTTLVTAASPVVAVGYPITASGAADGNYTITYVAGTLTVTPATPSLHVSASGGTYDGSPFPASVTVGGSGSGNSPATSLEDVAPTLVYYVGSGTSGTPLGPTPPSASGTYTVVGSFAGSTDYSAVQAAPVTFTIAQAQATVGLTSSAGSAVFGQPVTFTATVSDGATSGSVTFSDGGTTLGSVAISGSGTATLTTSALGIGSQSITASYSGNTDFTGATSGPDGVSVAKAATQVVLVPHAVFKKKKVASVGLEAEIAPVAPGGGLPSGIVTFEVRKTKKKEIILGTRSLGGGEATLAVKPNSVLKKPITILYSGDGNFQAATTSLTLTTGSLKSMAQPTVRSLRRR